MYFEYKTFVPPLEACQSFTHVLLPVGTFETSSINEMQLMKKGFVCFLQRQAFTARSLRLYQEEQKKYGEVFFF